jgi:hypothetical protein
MSVSDTIESLDKYCVEYIRFVLSVTSRRVFVRRGSDADLNNKIITFSVISVVLGDFLYTTYVAGGKFSESDTIPRLVREFSLWIALSVVSFVGVNVFSPRESRSRFIFVLVVVLRVLPSAYVISCYVGVIFHAVDVLFSATGCRTWHAIAATIASRCLFSGYYLAFAFMNLKITLLVDGKPTQNQTLSAIRSISVSAIVVILMLATDIVVIGAYLYAGAESQAPAVIASVRSSPSSLQVLSNTTSVPLNDLAACLPGNRACDVDKVTAAVFKRRRGDVGDCFEF